MAKFAAVFPLTGTGKFHYKGADEKDFNDFWFSLSIDLVQAKGLIAIDIHGEDEVIIIGREKPGDICVIESR